MRIFIGRPQVNQNTVVDVEPEEQSTLPAELPSDDDDSFEISGLQVRGLKLESIEGGKALLSAALKPGTYSFPGNVDKIEVRIPNNCFATISVEFGKIELGDFQVKALKIALSTAAIIENPASAFLKKKNSLLGDAASLIGDTLAKVHVRGLTIGDDGFLHVEGDLVKGGIFRTPLSEKIEDDLPQLDLDVRHLIGLPSPSSKDRAFAIDFLKTVGQMVGEINYALDLDVQPTVLSVSNDEIDLKTQKQSIKAHIQGKMALNPLLDFSLSADSEKSFITSVLGKMLIGGFFKIEHSLDKSAHVDLSILGRMIDLPEFDINGHQVSAKSLKLIASSVADIGPGDDFSVANGSSRILCEVQDPRMKVEGTGCHLYGEMGASLDVREFKMHDLSAKPAFNGHLSVFLRERFSSNSSVRNQRHAEMNFRLHHSGRWSILPSSRHVESRFFSLPFQAAYRPKMTNIDSLDSLRDLTAAEFNRRIETVTKSHIRSGNNVELLVDGIQSYPRRLELIEHAKESIWLETLVFEDDVSGMTTARALADRAQHGIEVYVIVDGQASAQDLIRVVEENKAFKLMQAAGVHLRLHNDSAIVGLRYIIDVLVENKLTLFSKEELLQGPVTRLVAIIAHAVTNLQGEGLEIPETQRAKIVTGINKVLGRPDEAKIDMAHPVLPTNSTGSVELNALIECVQIGVKQIYSWHEKHLIVDGRKAIFGGLNISDPYMFGGRLYRNREGKISQGWRDTDLLIEGPAVEDGAAAFAKNWYHLTGETLPIKKYIHGVDKPVSENSARVQIIQHSPSIDGDNHITTFMVAQLHRLQEGERAVFENAYFCSSSSLSEFFDALISAAKRGVRVIILTNSILSTDLPAINKAAFHVYRDLLKAGVRIFERKDERTIHSKVAVLGNELAIVGSANLDNRSARINSEIIAAVYDKDFAKKLGDVIEIDLGHRVARELTMQDIASVPTVKSAHFAAMSLIQDFC